MRSRPTPDRSAENGIAIAYTIRKAYSSCGRPSRGNRRAHQFLLRFFRDEQRCENVEARAGRTGSGTVTTCQRKSVSNVTCVPLGFNPEVPCLTNASGFAAHPPGRVVGLVVAGNVRGSENKKPKVIRAAT